MISVSDIYKSFGTQQVLAGVSMEIEEGTTTAIVGPSGTGKSVMIKIITGLLDSDSGEVKIHGESMTNASASKRQELRSDLGLLFQAAALFDSLSLIENVSFPLIHRERVPRGEARDRAEHYLKLVGLGGQEEFFPGEVSIGTRKRAGIARALITEPKFVLFDEPNTGLDPQTGHEIYELMNEVREQTGFTGIVISHEIPEVFHVCERVTMLYNGQVEFDGSVDEFLGSENPVVSQFRSGAIEGPIRID